MNKELIKKARQTNLAEYLMGVGVPLKRTGNRHKHGEHDSLVFTENSYYWNSRGEHGNSIDYLTRHMGYDFISAVLALAPSVENKQPRKNMTSGDFELDQQTLNGNTQKAKTYLTQKRCISSSIVDYLKNENLIFQQKQTNNIVFAMRDENNKIIGAELHGVTEKRFKGIAKNSKYGYGFNVRFSNDDTYDYALFFESAVDLISFMDYKLNYEKKSLERCILISMAGLKINIVKHTLGIFRGVRMVLCIDNDSAGEVFKDKLTSAQIDYLERQPDPQYKDWNEQLTATKKHNKPIERLLKRGNEAR